MLTAFINGFILAFGLIIPLGVQNIFVFNQGATQNRFILALPGVLTAALCDTLLITLAVLGVSLIVLELAWLKTTILVIGFFFLLYMGWATWKSKIGKLKGPTPLSPKKQIGFALSVSLLNPHAIIDTIAVIGSNSLNYSGYAKWSFTWACILVSFAWFFCLAIAGRTMHKLDQSGTWLNTINKFSALIIWSVALYMLWELLK